MLRLSVALALTAAFACAQASKARAYECPDFELDTLPSAEQGSYPPDRIVLRTDCIFCEGVGLEVSLAGEPVEGMESVLGTGQQAFVFWRPSAPLEVGATYDLYRRSFWEDFNGTATIRPADDAGDGRGADPFASVDWRLTELESITASACCDDDYEESCGPICASATTLRPVLEVSGTSAPWFVYWLSTEDDDVTADASAGPLLDGADWTLQATLRYPADEICVRLSARNLLTDEEQTLDHCETVAPSTSFEPTAWPAEWIEGCASVPLLPCDDASSPVCGRDAEELAAAWCGSSLDQCRANRGELNADYCDAEAEICAPFWTASGDDAGTDAGVADAGTDDAAVSDASERDDSDAGCAVSTAPERSRWHNAWSSLAVIAVVLARLRRQRRLHNS